MTSRQITIKFYLKHHWGGGKAALCVWSDWIRTLVSKTTDISHSVIIGKRHRHVFLAVFDRIIFILAGNDYIHKRLIGFQILPWSDNIISTKHRN